MGDHAGVASRDCAMVPANARAARCFEANDRRFSPARYHWLRHSVPSGLSFSSRAMSGRPTDIGCWRPLARPTKGHDSISRRGASTWSPPLASPMRNGGIVRGRSGSSRGTRMVARRHGTLLLLTARRSRATPRLIGRAGGAGSAERSPQGADDQAHDARCAARSTARKPLACTSSPTLSGMDNGEREPRRAPVARFARSGRGGGFPSRKCRGPAQISATTEPIGGHAYRSRPSTLPV